MALLSDILGGGLVSGGIETTELVTDLPYTVPVGIVHFHPFMNVLIGETLTVDGKLLTHSDTIAGTVTVNPGGVWDVI